MARRTSSIFALNMMRQSMDYRETETIASRINELLKLAMRKTKSKYRALDIQRALIGAICLLNNQKFIDHVHYTYEAYTFGGESNISRPAPDELKQICTDYWALTRLAYKESTRDLVKALEKRGFALIRHFTGAVGAGDVVYYTAFCLETKEFIVGVRGTKTLDDALTDTIAVSTLYTCEPHSPFDSADEGNVILGHEGMLAAAKKMCRDILPLLKAYFVPGGYSVKLFGHSLGGGSAALLGILLRAQFKDLHAKGRLQVYGYGAAAVVDIDTAMACHDFVTIMVNRSDLVPRLSAATFEIVTRKLESLLEFLNDLGVNSFWKIIKSVLQRKNFVSEVMKRENLEKLMDIMNPDKESIQIDDVDHLYLPGRIIGFYSYLDSLPKEGVASDPRTRAAVIAPTHPMLHHVSFSMAMFKSHLPAKYAETFERFLVLEPEKELFEYIDDCIEGIDPTQDLN